jgi:hypothetical protein
VVWEAFDGLERVSKEVVFVEDLLLRRRALRVAGVAKGTVLREA